jgi:hypothetical protein
MISSRSLGSAYPVFALQIRGPKCAPLGMTQLGMSVPPDIRPSFAWGLKNRAILYLIRVTEFGSSQEES